MTGRVIYYADLVMTLMTVGFIRLLFGRDAALRWYDEHKPGPSA